RRAGNPERDSGAHVSAVRDHEGRGHRTRARHLQTDRDRTRRNALLRERRVRDHLRGVASERQLVARILIADDKKGMREVLAQSLEAAGHAVQVVSDGEAAIRAIDHDLDLVVTDLRMPGKDGMEVLKAAMGRSSPPAVIVMTAFGSVDSAVEAMRIGAADFVAKPFGLAEMETKVTKALGG